MSPAPTFGPGSPCPCGTSKAYSACCGRFHQGEVASDAEQLMRSRYCAYVLRLNAYLLATWHTKTRPAVLDLDSDPVTWLSLKVVRHVPAPDDMATVEFVARYRVKGRGARMHEHSSFVRENGRWYYLAGEVSLGK